jgi:hypothetical protein
MFWVFGHLAMVMVAAPLRIRRTTRCEIVGDNLLNGDHRRMSDRIQAYAFSSDWEAAGGLCDSLLLPHFMKPLSRNHAMILCDLAGSDSVDAGRHRPLTARFSMSAEQTELP